LHFGGGDVVINILLGDLAIPGLGVMRLEWLKQNVVKALSISIDLFASKNGSYFRDATN
jgi:hypothetical protein